MMLNVFRVVDAIIDPIASCMAKNIAENIEVVAQNRLARTLAEMPDEQLSRKGICREKLRQGSDAYPWRSSISDNALDDLEDYLERLMDSGFESPKAASYLLA